jgi:hypothetical protein
MATTINAGTATSGAAISADTSGVLQLQSGSTPTTAVTIDTSQNVGIGATSSLEKLTVATSGSNVYTKTTDGTVNLYVGITNSSATGINGTISNHPYAFFTNNAERMRIDTSGNLLVGTTSTIGSATGVLQVKGVASQNAMQVQIGTNGNNGILWYNASGSAIGSIVVNSGSVAYNTSSDYRLKENIAPMTGALATVSQLKPVTYKWKSDGSNGQGFIAHELQSVVPDCVTGEKDAVNEDGSIKAQGIDTSFLVATLTAAIQELNAKVTTLEAQLGVK